MGQANGLFKLENAQGVGSTPNIRSIVSPLRQEGGGGWRRGEGGVQHQAVSLSPLKTGLYWAI